MKTNLFRTRSNRLLPDSKITGIVSLSVIITGFWIASGKLMNAAEQASTNAPAETKPAVEAKPEEPLEYYNWLEFSVGHFFVEGDKAQFQRRSGMPAGTFGGVEDFHLEQKAGKQGLFTIDGRGIFDNHDYALKLQLTEPDKGYVQFGYREFRTWYDGSGGFYPGGTNHWFDLYSEQMHVDRGEVWFESGLRIPGVPELTLRYSHEFRCVKKDSTVWGDSAALGIASANNSRGIVPSFWSIDEKRDIFSLDARHTISKTLIGAGFRYDKINNDDSRNIHRRPGELTGS